MSIVYTDSTSYVSRSDPCYTTMKNYQQTGNSTQAPLRSVLKLSVAPGSQKYFSVTPDFQMRTDNIRTNELTSVPISLDKSVSMATPASVNAGAVTMSASNEKRGFSDYSSPY
jgi:hypothetical protein